MVSLHVSTRFKKSYKKLPRHIKKDFDKRILVFESAPFHYTLGTHKLGGSLGDYYSFYLRDGFRVLFDFVGDAVVILVNVGSHDDYKKWAK